MKRYIFLLLFLTGFLSLHAQSMKEVFINMPDQYIPQLEVAWKKDLVDLYTSGKEARLQNTMNGYSHLQKLTDNYLLLKITEKSTAEMKLLPLVNNTYIVCMVVTVNGPVEDSRIEFYSTEWEPLPSEDLFTSVSTSWFIKDDADQTSNAFNDAIARLDMDLIKYQLSPDNLQLTATYTTPSYLSSKEREKVLPFLKDSPKVYTWERSRFK